MDEMNEVRLMTDEECVSVLKKILEWYHIFPRGCGKTMTRLRCIEALCRAIEVLEEKG